jgi:hypothetical protein
MDETLAPGEKHEAWAKFKTDAFSDDKYSLNIASILNRPFEGLALNRAEPPPPSRDGVFRLETKVAGLTAELNKFVYAGMFITAEVTFRNGGFRSATFCCQEWQLINEQTGYVECA